MYRLLICCAFAFTFYTINPLEAAYQKVNGRWVEDKYVPFLSLEEHLKIAQEALEQEDYAAALKHFQIVIHNYDEHEMGLAAIYSAGVCQLHLGQYEESNQLFNQYLRESERNRYFEPIMAMKFEIAEKFRKGAKRRPFGSANLPRILSGKELASSIYDEIAIGLPRSDLAAQALLSKATMLRAQRHYTLSSQALQQIIADFGNHPLCLQAFEDQAKTYLEEMSTTSRNEELLELAQLNIQKMKIRFPGADLSHVEACLKGMRELYAQSLYEAASLYKRKGKKEASALYEQRLMRLYVDTESAKKLKEASKK